MKRKHWWSGHEDAFMSGLAGFGMTTAILVFSILVR